MTENDIYRLAQQGLYDGNPLHAEVLETHISWVLLTERFAFKIKKPVNLDFLDFSSLEKRKHYCERELFLNQRFSPIYLCVLPISYYSGDYYLGNGRGDIVDFCVQMVHIDNDRKLDIMIEKNVVTTDQLKALAKTLFNFHRQAEVISQPFDLDVLYSEFNDIRSWGEELPVTLRKTYVSILDNACGMSGRFLAENISIINERVRLGYRRDVHGDLHTRNIFFTDKPVLFDCIEFDDDLRKVDLLDELAFLCMDLESMGRRDLADVFLEEYLKFNPCMRNATDLQLFVYYKAYRANIRAKVSIINMLREQKMTAAEPLLSSVQQYLVQMQKYMGQLK